MPIKDVYLKNSIRYAQSLEQIYSLNSAEYCYLKLSGFDSQALDE